MGRGVLNRRVIVGLQLAPAIIYFAAFFVGPFLGLIALAFWTTRGFDFFPDITLDNLVTVATDRLYHVVFLRTISLAFVTTLIAVVIAYVFAFVATFVYPRRRQTLYFLVLVTLFGSYLVRIYAWRTILGAEGVVNGTLIGIGLIDEPLRFLLNSPIAIVVAMTNFLIPVAILPIYAAMQNVSPRLLEAARDLGSGPVDTVRRVVLPLTMPGVRVAVAFTFIAAAGDFATPSLLGGGPWSQLIGTQMGYQFQAALNWPLGSAIALALIIVLVVFSVLLAAITRRLTRT